MKRISILSFLLFLLSFAWISCDEFLFEKELDLSHLTGSPKLVLNGVIYAGVDTNIVRYAQSYPIFDPDNSREILYRTNSWGDGWYYLNDTVYYLSDVETHYYIDNQEQETVFVKDSITYLPATAENGQTLRIEAQWKDQKISASTSIPNKQEFSILNNDPNDVVLLLKDEKGVKNYFRLLVFCEMEVRVRPEVAEKYGLPLVIEQSFQTDYNSDDPVLTWGNPENDDSDFDVTNFEQNYFSIFTDTLFTNSETELRLRFSNNSFINLRFIEIDNEIEYIYLTDNEIEYEVERYYISIQALSKELYNYYASLSSYTQMNDYVVEPIRIYSNIEGGLGVFGAINEQTLLVSETITEYEEY